MTGCEKKMLNKTGKQMGVGKNFRAEPAVGITREKRRKCIEHTRETNFRNWKLGTGSAECREHSNPELFLESDLEFPELGPPPPRGAEGLESRSTIFANILQLSSPGLQFLPINHNSRLQVYKFCQYITTLESRSTILPIYHNSRVQV